MGFRTQPAARVQGRCVRRWRGRAGPKFFCGVGNPPRPTLSSYPAPQCLLLPPLLSSSFPLNPLLFHFPQTSLSPSFTFLSPSYSALRKFPLDACFVKSNEPPCSISLLTHRPLLSVIPLDHHSCHFTTTVSANEPKISPRWCNDTGLTVLTQKWPPLLLSSRSLTCPSPPSAARRLS